MPAGLSWSKAARVTKTKWVTLAVLGVGPGPGLEGIVLECPILGHLENR